LIRMRSRIVAEKELGLKTGVVNVVPGLQNEILPRQIRL
jgi:hypothetical protein